MYLGYWNATPHDGYTVKAEPNSTCGIVLIVYNMVLRIRVSYHFLRHSATAHILAVGPSLLTTGSGISIDALYV
jgi:hypothetical protein